MMRILGIDAGNHAVKVYGGKGEFAFPSAMGEYRERNLESRYSENDLVYEYKGQKGFAGTLALHESEFAISRTGASKAHAELPIRVLLALHRYGGGDDFRIVVGQPIKKHNPPEKAKIKKLLEGRHQIVVNGVLRDFLIDRVEVAPEGAAAFWSAPRNGKVRILDFGSGTVNAATLINGGYNDRDSFTLEYGLETIQTDDPAAMVRHTAIQALKRWKEYDPVYVCGGGAEAAMTPLRDYFETVLPLAPRVADGQGGFRQLSPVYANAVGFYMVASKAFGGGGRGAV